MVAASTDRLIGREAELELLQGLVAGLRRGRLAIVFIEGEAGIGKTRLLGALADAAGKAGVAVLHGEAHALERTRPFGPLIDALDLRPGSRDPRRARIGRLMTEGGETGGRLQFRVADEIIDLLEVLSDRGPVFVSLEDLHWADSATLMVLRGIGRRLEHAPLLLAATLRPSPRPRALRHLLDDELAADAGMIALRPLGERAVHALVTAELGRPPGPALADAVGRAGGNPLWIVELLRALSADDALDLSGDSADVADPGLPESLRELVVRRLGYLPDHVVALLRSASVLGDSFSLADLATVTGRSVTDLVAGLDAAFQARLVGDQEGRVVFRHALVHEAVYRDVPEAARIALHREAGRRLASSGAPITQVASHMYLGAGRGDLEAVACLQQAAHEVLARSPGVAVELLRRAESLLPDGHPARDRVMVALVQAMLRAGDVAEAAAVAEAVLARSHAGDAERPLRLSLIDALSLQNRAAELIVHGEAALARATTPADRAFALAQTSYGHTFSGDLVAGERTARRALALAEQAADPAMTAWSLTTLSVAAKTQGRYAEALELTERALRLAFDPPDAGARLRHPHFFRGLALADSDRLDEAAEAYRRAQEECGELGSAWILPDTRLMAAELRFLSGEWEHAVPELDAGLQAAADQGAGVLVAQSRGYLAVIAAARGDGRAAEAALAPVADASEVYGHEIVAYARSLLAEAADEPGRALDVLVRAWRRGVARKNRYYHRYLGPAIVRLALGLGDRVLATEVTEEVEEGAAPPEVPTVQSAALRCRGLLDDDPATVLAAVEQAVRGGRFLDHGGACEDAAAVLASRGRSDEARPLLDAAIDRYEQAGAAWLTARASAALRAAGGRRGSRAPRRRAPGGWESLTRAERAVAELVAQGLTNREVAQRLFVSPHTVNTHLRHVFRKAEVTSRAGLAAKASRDHAFE